MKICLLLIEFISFMFTGSLPDTTGNRTPEKLYFKAQYAGNLGFLSGAAGYEFPRSIFRIDLNIGYLPKGVSGVRVITFSLKPALDILKFKVLKADVETYAGAGINYSIGRNIHGKIPDYYPLDYYWPNAFHLTPFAGVLAGSLKMRNRRLFFYCEAGTMDYHIWYAVKTREISFDEIFNLGFGILLR